MKPRRVNPFADARQQKGWTLIETLLVVFGLVILAVLILPAFSRASCCSKGTSCISNSKQLAVAYAMWAGDHQNRAPWDISTRDGGWKELAFGTEAGRYCATNYTILYPYCGNRKMIACPLDERKPLTNYPHDRFNNTNISYFVGINAGAMLPHSILGGDRNLAPGDKPQNDYGYSPSNGLGLSVTLSTNSTASSITWSRKMHSANSKKNLGVLIMANGSAEFVDAQHLRADYQPYAGVPLWPRTNFAAAGDYRNHSTFRLVFP